MESERVGLLGRIFPYRAEREVDIVNSSGKGIKGNETSSREDGAGAPDLDADPVADELRALRKASGVRRADPANDRAQHPRDTASFEDAHEPFDNHGPILAVDVQGSTQRAIPTLSVD